MNELQAHREQAIHLLRAGIETKAVAGQLGRSPQWVRKWRRRFQAEGWAGLRGQSHTPHHHGRRLPEEVHQAVWQARSELEAEAARGTGLKYIGGIAVRTRLKAQGIQPLPSVRSIERLLQAAHMTRPRPAQAPIRYPRLRPDRPQQLCQVDQIPRYLQGGEQVYCFNAIDVVSRYPTGQVKRDRRATTAADFLVHVWQTIGIPTYTQVDNEACFSGGCTHPYVLGQCVRLALRVGTELVFSPVRHPQSNGCVERFHQDYQQHVWQDTYLADPTAVQRQAEHFFGLYRHSAHHSALQGQTPHECHHQVPPIALPANFVRSAGKLPLYVGRVHFMRRVDPDDTVAVLNVNWSLPPSDRRQGVWVTLAVRLQQATLTIYDQPPDVPSRQPLAVHPFPLSEPVLERPPLRGPGGPQTDPQSRPVLDDTHRSAVFPPRSRTLPRPANLWMQPLVRAPLERLKQLFRETIY